jgi:hypothetical protein
MSSTDVSVELFATKPTQVPPHFAPNNTLPSPAQQDQFQAKTAEKLEKASTRTASKSSEAVANEKLPNEKMPPEKQMRMSLFVRKESEIDITQSYRRNRGLSSHRAKKVGDPTVEQKRLNQDVKEYISRTRVSEGVISHDNKYLKYWHIFYHLAVYYGFLVTTFRSSYFHHGSLFEWDEFIVDLIFLTDIVLKFRTSYYASGNVIYDLNSIRRRYCESGFFMDFVAVIPLGWLVFAVTHNYHSARLSFLNRLINLRKIPHEFDQLLQVSGRLEVVTFFRLFKLLVYWFGAIHTIACWRWAYTFLYEFAADDWMIGMEYASMNMWTQYINTLTWALLFMIGQADVATPDTFPEYSFSIIVLFFSLAAVAYFISTVLRIVDASQADLREFKESLSYLGIEL